jgi:hypothetical protein
MVLSTMMHRAHFLHKLHFVMIFFCFFSNFFHVGILFFYCFVDFKVELCREVPISRCAFLCYTIP